MHVTESAMQPQAVAECVASKWIDTNASTHIVPNGDTRVVVVPTGGGTTTLVMMTLTASPTASGSHIEMRTTPTLGTFNEQWDQARSCL